MEDQTDPMEGKPSTDKQSEESKPKAGTALPPTIITDTTPQKGKEGNEADGATTVVAGTGGDVSSQARTPKHANKKEEEASKEEEVERSGNDDDDTQKHRHHPQMRGSSSSHWQPGPHPPSHMPPNYIPGNYPGNSYDGRHGPPGAFQPREMLSYPPAHPGPRSFFPPPYPGHNRFSGPPPHHPPYDQRYGPGGDYGRYDHQPGNPGYPPRHPYGGHPPPMYPPPPYGNGSFDGSAGRPWGPPPPFPHGRPTLPNNHSMSIDHPPHQHATHYPRGHGPNTGGSGGGTFSRAVSSSFDRSVKSREERQAQHGPGSHADMHMSELRHPYHHGLHHHGSHHDAGDNGSVSEDGSWRQLNQVHSVDEDEMRKRLEKSTTPEERDKDMDEEQPASTNSSLTNSPTEGLEAKKEMAREGNKKSSSLDSLSSVASAQEPIETKPSAKTLSPTGSNGSLDLMKCASGSSGLLSPSHQPEIAALSFPLPPSSTAAKRQRDERRGDVDTLDDSSDVRKGPSQDRPAKKGRTDSKDSKKDSPLSITCSPPTSPHDSKRKGESKVHQPQAVYPQKDQSPGSFYDRAPAYSYSMDSAPSIPHQRSRPEHGYPPLPPRPGSSSSSTITPMNVDAGISDTRHPPGVGQLPSWEIHPQDSFGGGSTGGGNHQLMSSFSFQHDYPMLSASASGEHGHPPGPHPNVAHLERNPNQTLESRNQSFEGGHYHGSFARSDSMMSYETRGPPYDGRQGYTGAFPPHAPSWGSASSYPSSHGHAYGQYRASYPPMVRNFSEESSARASPPLGGAAPGGLRMMPPNFQPPPEFRAPPSMVSKSVPQNTILTSPYQPTPTVGPYGWSKDEDDRLTDIMKKYKNPRDWEPIAKEHNRGRTAKECHERWIRYLKPGVRKGQWTDHEDAIVTEAVTTSSEQPFTRWSDLAQRLPGRVGKQIRDRWVNHLNPNINHLPFSREDDLRLWEGHKKLGKRWVEISTKYFNSSRSENHIKNRWYSASFKKFIANEFGPEAYSGTKSGKKDPSSAPSSPEKKKKTSSSPRRRNADVSKVESV